MQRCRIILVSILLALGGTCSYAQEKVVESSTRHAPEWIGTAIRDYVVTGAEAATLSAAKDMAINDIRSQIVSAVASNVISISRTDTRSIKVDDEEAYSREYYSHVQTTAANLPFVSGISLSDDVESYWERRYIKNEKRHYYSYHLKYHFPKSRLDRLIAEYREMDASRWSRYTELKQQLDSFSNVEDIQKAVNELASLASWFEEGYRKEAVLALRKSYIDSYSGIYLIPISNTPGCFVYRLQLNGRSLECSAAPSLKSEYATHIECIPSGDMTYVVRYCYDGVREYDRKEILLVYRFGPKTLRYVIDFKLQ